MNRKIIRVMLVCLVLYSGAAQGGGVVQDNSGRKVLYWHDPMVPGTRFDKPGKSPFMDMQLVPKYAEEAVLQAAGKSPVISVSPANVQKMGVRTGKAVLAKQGGTLRATGIVAENERLQYVMSSQVAGRIGDLALSAAGDPVRKGEVFYSLYSPELYALQSDFIAARKSGIRDLAEAARKRLLFLGIDKSVIDGIAKSGKPLENVPFTAPANGIVKQLDMRAGQYINANDKLAEIQDLSVIWIEAAVPESALTGMQAGDAAEIAFTGEARRYQALVDYIYPGISPETRTGKVRLVLDNKEGMIRPAGYAEVVFAVEETEVLTVPSSAVLRSSRGDHVLLSLGAGKFQPRSVTTGATSAGRTEIIAGLQEGDDVVTAGQFLIDSESNLNEALEKAEENPHAGH